MHRGFQAPTPTEPQAERCSPPAVRALSAGLDLLATQRPAPLFCAGCEQMIPVSARCVVLDPCFAGVANDDTVAPFGYATDLREAPTVCMDCVGEIGRRVIERVCEVLVSDVESEVWR